MRFIFYAAFALFTIFCVIIAVSNGDPVNFSLSPFPLNITMPAFMLVFIGVFIGLIGGWVVSIFSGIGHARRHRLADKKIKALEKELKTHQNPTNQLSKSANHGKSASD